MYYLIYNNTDTIYKNIINQRIEELEMYKKLCCHNIGYNNIDSNNYDLLNENERIELKLMITYEEDFNIIQLMDSISLKSNNNFKLQIFNQSLLIMTNYSDNVKNCILHLKDFFSMTTILDKSTNESIFIDNTFLLYKCCNNIIEKLIKTSLSNNDLLQFEESYSLHLINPKNLEENKLSKLFDDTYIEIQDVLIKLDQVILIYINEFD